jgi:hypothetical protein
MSDVVDETRQRAERHGRPSRRGLPTSGRLIAAFALAVLSGLMLLRWLTYSVPRCVAAPAYIQTIPPTRTGEPEPEAPPAPQAAPASDDCSSGSLLGFVLPSISRANASLVSDARSDADADARTRLQFDEVRQTNARPSPTPTTNDNARPNIFKRFLRWLFKPLLRNKTISGNSPPERPIVRAVTLSDTKVSLCKERYSPSVRVAVSADSVHRGTLTYEFEADAGSVTHEAPGEAQAVWDLSSAKTGSHTLKVVAREQRPDSYNLASEPYAVKVEVESLFNCRSGGENPCENFSIKGPPVSPVNKSLRLTADLGPGVPDALEYSWKVSQGSITDGQGRRSVTVETAGLGDGQIITAEVKARLERHTCEASTQVRLAVPLDGETVLRGRVIGRLGVGVPNVRVSAIRNGKEVGSPTYTSGNGSFTLSVPFGTYLLKAEMPPTFGSFTYPLPDPTEMAFTFSPDSRNVVIPLNVSILTPTPTPVPSPSPNESPTPEASPASSPTPGETPTPTATPSPTPVESPTPAEQKRKIEDRISVNRPERLLEGQEESVTCALAMVYGEVIPVETFQNGVATVIDKPSTPQGGQKGPLSESFGEDYTSFAQFKIVSDDLDFALDSPSVQPVPSEVNQKADWTWKVRLKDGATKKTVSFTVRLDVVWRPKTGGGPDIVRSVWERRFENIPVGLPLDVKASKYGSLIGGIGALGIFAVPGLRRRRLDELDVEIERLQRGQTGNAVGRDLNVSGVSIDPSKIRLGPIEGMALNAESPPAVAEADELSCSVFTRSEASPGDSFIVQVFAHLAEQAEQLAARALKTDELAEERGSETLDAPVARGDELTVKLDMPTLEVDEPVQSFVWKGVIKCLQFGVSVPEGCAPKSLFGKVTVCQNTVPIGHIRFAFKVLAGGAAPIRALAAVEPARAEQPAGEFVRYRQAFISYCSKDRAEVLRRVQMLRLVKLKFRQDLLDLEPGQKWESTLYRYIDESDVFFLFWSKAAKESEWIEKELRHALERKGGRDEAPPEIIPVIIEGPPPAAPPSYLAADHFNDTLQYFVWVEDQLKNASRGPQSATPPDDAGAA